MEPKKLGAPRKPEDEKLIQKSFRFKRRQLDKIDLYGMDWLRDVVDLAKPPKSV